MDLSTFNTLRNAVDGGYASYGQMADIDGEFEKIDPATLNDRPENAMASDKLDEIEARIPYETAAHMTDGGQRYLYDPRVIKEDARVVAALQVTTREPGDDDEKEIIVEPGTTGTVRGYVEPWFHLHVELDDGRHVWLCPDEVNFLHPEHTRCADECGLAVTHDGPCLDRPGGRVVCGPNEHTPFRQYYTSADGPGDDSTWSVYIEAFTDSDAGTPIEGSVRKVSTHPTEAEADAEATRLHQKEV